MNIKNIILGLAVIALGVWMYFALSTFKVEEDSSPKRIIISEGTVRSVDEVAAALSEEMKFDLQGAYKTGYTSRHVVDYLIKEPHDYPVTFHEGQYYEGRRTVLYIIPLSVCIFIIVAGTGIIFTKGFSRKKK